LEAAKISLNVRGNREEIKGWLDGSLTAGNAGSILLSNRRTLRPVQKGKGRPDEKATFKKKTPVTGTI